MRIRQSKRKALATAIAIAILAFFALLGALVMLAHVCHLKGNF